MRNVVIIGSGCAGNTAAIYTARANLKPLVVSGHEAGGQLSLTTLVENFPGFPEGINGPELVENMKQQAENFGAEYMHGAVLDADLSAAPVPPQHRRRVDRNPHRDHRLRRLGALAGPGIRTETDRPWRQLLRHLRRVFLPRQADHGGGRRRFRHGGGQLPHALRPRSHAGPPARRVPRLEDHAGPRPPQSQDQVPHQHRGGRRPRRVGKIWSPACACAMSKPAKCGTRTWMASSWPSATSPTPRFSRARSIPTPTATSSRKGGARTNIPGVFHAGDVQDRMYRQAITASGAGCMAAIEVERFLEAEGH